MMPAQLHQELLADLRETRGDVLSPSTLKNHEDVWRLYLLPAAGHRNDGAARLIRVRNYQAFANI